ncbi:MAG: Rieske (2Fe-2S) protein [Geothrix sp.]|uniref:QcrA and Rieske domain-containing protein n=1 Tax=Geothrix sp. TaxID=1962974 RepID=UPI001839FE4B|nr:Rieske (2Fe-2S) protein [Geothrix sp.]NWJ41594.1 Rieske (2Fe-2S) protein [Geothrix sp.]WIL20424.1 MAG: Rieske (2Fe-2S) protein [Geothrix sp.]
MTHDRPLAPMAPDPSRRAFCATACALAMATALRGSTQTPAPGEHPPDPHPVKLTEATRAQLTPGTVLDYRRLGAFYLAADDRGVFALTAICTHRGCLVLSEGPTGFGCPCHDSAYNLQGEVTEGPAKLPLRHLAVQETEPGGRLQVDTSTTVPPELRL